MQAVRNHSVLVIGEHTQLTAFGDEVVDFEFQAGQHLVIFEVAELALPFFEIDSRRPALEAQVGIVGFPRPVYPATHDRDRDAVA